MICHQMGQEEFLVENYIFADIAQGQSTVVGTLDITSIPKKEDFITIILIAAAN